MEGTKKEGTTPTLNSTESVSTGEKEVFFFADFRPEVVPLAVGVFVAAGVFLADRGVFFADRFATGVDASSSSELKSSPSWTG
jgi:hypothetical protein